MLRISKMADYGTLIMVYLARRSTQLCNAREIAEQTHVHVPTVSKLLKRLTLAGLLRSERGVHGGYRLSRPADEISLAQIIYAVDDVRGLTECTVGPDACSLQGICHIQGHWRVISQVIDEALRRVNLTAFLRSPTAHDIA